MNNKYVLTHKHRHGTDFCVFHSKLLMGELQQRLGEVVERLELDYEPDREEELDIFSIDDDVKDLDRRIKDHEHNLKNTNYELYRVIKCTNCNNWEELPADQQRHHVHSFQHLSNDEEGDNSTYRCHGCGSEVKSFLSEKVE